MGVVYKAEDTILDRPVALKFLAHDVIERTEFKAPFIQEAKAAAIGIENPDFLCLLIHISVWIFLQIRGGNLSLYPQWSSPAIRTILSGFL